MCFSLSYLDCIPKCFAKDSLVTKVRIRQVFGKFVRTFQERTVEKGRFDTQTIMCKYISTLERLVPSFGVETFDVLHLKLWEAWEKSGSLDTCARCENRAAATHEIMVNGNKGIWWRIPIQTVS